MEMLKNMLKIVIVLLVMGGALLAIGLPLENPWWFIYSFVYIILFHGFIMTYPKKVSEFLK